MGTGDTWQWSLLKRDMWGDGAARPWSSPVSQFHRPLDNALGHSWASSGAVLGSTSSHQLSFLSCQTPFGSWALVQSIYLPGELLEETGFIAKLWLQGKERGLGYSVGLVLSQCILHRHLSSAACAYELGCGSVMVPASPVDRCVHLGHCRHCVPHRSSLLNTKGEFALKCRVLIVHFLWSCNVSVVSDIVIQCGHPFFTSGPVWKAFSMAALSIQVCSLS